MTKFIVLLKCAYHFENFFAQLHFITQESQKIFWRGRELRWAYIFIFDVENRFKNISLKVVNIILRIHLRQNLYKTKIALYMTQVLILHLFRNTLEASAQPLHLLWLFVCTLRKTNTKLRRIKAKSNKRHNKNKVGIGLIRYNDANVSGYFNNKWFAHPVQ